MTIKNYNIIIMIFPAVVVVKWIIFNIVKNCFKSIMTIQILFLNILAKNGIKFVTYTDIYKMVFNIKNIYIIIT